MKTKKTIVAGPLVMECIYPRGSARDSARERAAKRQLSSEAQQRMNQIYSYQKLELMIACNFRPGDLIVTLTYDEDHLPETRDQAQQCLKKFRSGLARLRRRKGLPQPRMIWNTENVFGSGRWHHHVIISRGSKDFSEIRSLWRWGSNVEISVLRIDKDHSYESLARYLCKEARERRGLRSWSYTRNCTHPEIDTVAVSDEAQIQPPKGATVYADSQARTEFGSYRFIKYLAPGWRDRKKRR